LCRPRLFEKKTPSEQSFLQAIFYRAPYSLNMIFAEAPKLLNILIFASACLARSLQKTSLPLRLKKTTTTNTVGVYYWLRLKSFQTPFNLTFHCKVIFPSKSLSQKFNGYLAAFFSIDFKKLVA
jgi:hypothetical protein